MIKSYQYLDIDINKKTYRRLRAVQGDSKSRYILVSLYDNSKAYNLSNCSVKVFGCKSDKKIFFNYAIVTDAINGKFEIELTNQALAVAGELEIQILMLGTNQERLTSFSFYIDVEKSIVNDGVIESANEFKALTGALSQVEEWNGYFEETSGKIEEKYTERLNNVDSQLEQNMNKVNEQFNTIDSKKADKNMIGTPLTANSVSEMSDTTKIYVNTSDSNWYYYNGSSWVIGGLYNSQGISDNSITPVKTTFFNRPSLINFFDKNIEKTNSYTTENKIVVNYYLTGPQGYNYAEGYAISGYCYVKGYKNIIVPYTSAIPDASVIADFYNSKNVRIGYTDASNAKLINNEYWLITIPSETYYARFTLNLQFGTNYENFYCINSSEKIDDIPAYNYNDFTLNNKYINIEGSINPLYKKSISWNGDSIMWGAGFKGGFAKMLADKNSMQYENRAVSGGTLSNIDWSPHCICLDVQNMNPNADYYIIEGGVNDPGWEGIITSNFPTKGEEDTLDIKAVGGAMEYICRELVTRFEGKKVGFIFVHNTKTPDHDYNTKFRPIMKKALEKWGVPYLDLHTQIPPLNSIDSLKKYTTNNDGYHPTEEGYRKYYVDKVEAWLKTL